MVLKKIGFLAGLALLAFASVLSGCNKDEPATEPSAAASSAAPVTGGAQPAPNRGAESTDAVPAPSGVKQDLSGGLK